MTTEQDTIPTTSITQENTIDELRELVAEVERVQQHELVDEFVRLFRSDAIAEFTAQVLPGSSAHGRATYEMEHVLFIRPDVAAVKVRQRYFTNDGTLESEGSPMYVVSREHGRWLLAANQNTPVVAG